jgi:nitrate/nitrite transporter NarK
MGRMYDVAGSYQYALILFMILPAVSAVCIWFVNPRAWKAQRADARRRPDEPAEGSPAVG